MSMNGDIFTALGVQMQDVVAGLSGGIVNAFVFKRSDPWSIIGSVVVGALTASYLSGPVGRYTGTTGNATAFIVGLAGMAICQGIIQSAKSWRPSFLNKENSDVSNRPPS